jgi:hypothetical protein
MSLTGVPHPRLFAVLTMTLAMVCLGRARDGCSHTACRRRHVAFGCGPLWFRRSGIADRNNCIQPAVIGGTAQLPFLPVLIGILGGIESFGLFAFSSGR